MSENIARFIETFTESLASRTFIKATLGNYKGADEHLQKISFRPITTKRGHRLFALYRYSTRDTAKNFAKAEAGKLIAELIDSGFKSGHLFTTETDLQLSIGKKARAGSIRQNRRIAHRSRSGTTGQNADLSIRIRTIYGR